MRWAPQSLPLAVPECGQWCDGGIRDPILGELGQLAEMGRRVPAAPPSKSLCKWLPPDPGAWNLRVQVGPGPRPPYGNDNPELKPSYGFTGPIQKTRLELPSNII